MHYLRLFLLDFLGVILLILLVVLKNVFNLLLLVLVLFLAFIGLFALASTLFRLVLFVLVDSLENAVHLGLEQAFQLVNHEFVYGALLHEVSHKALDGIAFIDNDSLQTEVSNVHIDIQLRLALVESFGTSLFRLLRLSQGALAIRAASRA